jgi:hypothetical protein
VIVEFCYTEILVRELGADIVIDHYEMLEDALSARRAALDLMRGPPL